MYYLFSKYKIQFNKKCNIHTYILVILCFMITVIGQKTHEIEILVNTVHIYSSNGLPIIIPTHKMGRTHDYKCMKNRITSVYTVYTVYNVSVRL